MNRISISDLYLFPRRKVLSIVLLILVILKLLYVFAFFTRILVWPVNDYQIGEILLNYHSGLQKRSLIGTIILWLSENRIRIMLLIKLIFLLSVFCLFISLFAPLKKLPVRFALLVAIIFICSPFGMSFYCDSWLKKEILFFPILLAATSLMKMNNTVIRFLLLNLLVVAGCLIHEAFICLGLPFIICICFLNGQKINDILSLLVVAFCSTALVYFYSVKPEPAMTNYVISLNHLGFDTTGYLTHPVSYLRMNTPEMIRFSFHRFKLSYFLMYCILYFLNAFFVFRIIKMHFIDPENIFCRKLLLSLLVVHISVIPLFFLGMDYGRWFSFVFIISLLLISNQLWTENPEMLTPLPGKKVIFEWASFCLFFLLINIPPLPSFNVYNPINYATAFLTFFQR